MNRSRLVSIPALVGVLVAGVPARAAEPPTLTKGEPVEGTLAVGESHEFTVKLKANQYLLLVTDQRGIDVIVRLHGPNGEQLKEVDQNGQTGLESLSFFSNVGGDYRVEIVPFDEQAEPGRYAVEVVRLEKAGRTPGSKIGQLLAPFARPNSPGASMAVIRDGETVYIRGLPAAVLVP